MDPLIPLNTIISLINVIILICLFITYIRIYKSSKANFTVGLMFFSVMMMLHSIFTIFAYFAMAPSFTRGPHLYSLAIHVTELVGLMVLLKITLI
jgi:hypothetical protein